MLQYRVKLGIFRQTAKFGQRPCLFHISNIGIKNKLTKQTVKILMRRLTVSSGFTLFAKVCPNLPDVRVYLSLPYSLKTLFISQPQCLRHWMLCCKVFNQLDLIHNIVIAPL